MILILLFLAVPLLYMVTMMVIDMWVEMWLDIFPPKPVKSNTRITVKRVDKK